MDVFTPLRTWAHRLLLIVSVTLVAACGGDGDGGATQANKGVNEIPNQTSTEQVTPAGANTLQVSSSVGTALELGETALLSVVYIDDQGQKSDVSAMTTYSIADTSVVTNPSGNQIEGTGGGQTQVTVTYRSISQTLMFDVAPSSVADVAIELDGVARFAQTQLASVRATGFYSNGNHADLTDKVTWSSSDTAILNFTGSGGEFEVLGNGNVEITATLPGSLQPITVLKTATSSGGTAPIVNGNASGSYTLGLEISNTDLAELRLHADKGPTMPVGAKGAFTATAIHNDGNHFDFSKTATWSSSDTSVATVSATGLVTAVGAGFTSITATHNGLTDSYRLRVVDAQVIADSLKVHGETTTLHAGALSHYSAVVTLSDGTQYDITNDASWSTNNAAVATVSSADDLTAGLVTGVSAGNAVISATFAGLDASAQATVIADMPVSLTVSTSATTLHSGANTQLTATATYPNGQTANVTPSTTFTSSTPGVVSVSHATGTQGKTQALQAGSTNVVASHQGVSHTTTLTVVDVAVTSLSLSPSSVSLKKGSSGTLKATATLSDSTTKDVTSSANYKSNDTQVGTAYQGKVTAVDAGTTTIDVTYKGKSAQASFTVAADISLQSLTVTAAATSLETGDATQLTAMGTYSDGNQIDKSSAVTWASSNTAVATISTAGKLVSHAAGTTNVTAKFDGTTSAAVAITVTAPAPVQSSGSGSGSSGSGSGGSSSGSGSSGSGTGTGTGTSSGSVSSTSLPTLKQFNFTASSNKTIPGSDGESGTQYGCSGPQGDTNMIGKIALLARFHQNGCFTDGRYNVSDFAVEQGTLASADGGSYEAYTISAPANQPTEFLGSEHYINYKPDAAGSYDIYTFDGHFTKVDSINATNTDWQPTNVSLSKLTSDTIFVIVPAGTNPSVLHSVSTDLQGAQIADIDAAKVFHYELALSGSRTPKDLNDFTAGPADALNRYGQNRYFFAVELNGGKLGVVWQDRNDYKIYLTKFDRRGTSTTVDLPLDSSKNYMLGAADSDASGTLYYVVFEAGNKDPNYNPTSDHSKVLSVLAYKSDENGVELKKAELNDSSNRLNATTFGDIASSTTATDGQYGNTVALKVAGNEVGIIYSRLHAQTSDGLNHQGADAIVLDASTLAIKQSHGQTSGHSFSNVMTTTSGDDFVGIDLGDNYPRGVHLHKFDGTSKEQRVVFTFKTRHGYVASHDGRGPFDPYIVDASNKQTYKWSNDNSTYTELGGVAEASDGWLVVFASEHDSNMKVLNNHETGDGLTLIDPRNIGFIKVTANIAGASGSGNVVSDDLVTTTGGSTPETGEFYSFDGIQQDQRVTGIKWLTQYTDKDQQNASRIRFSPRADGNYTVMWEQWTPNNYVSTHMMVIDANGAVVHSDEPLSGVRLHRRDDLLQIGNRTYTVTGNRVSGSLEITEIEEK